MKASFQTGNHGSTLDDPMNMMIQTQYHEPWNMISSNVNVRPCLHLNQRNELSEWVEQITKQLIDDDDDNYANTFPTSNDNNNNNDNMIDVHHLVKHDHDHCLSLMTLLFESAVVISVDNLTEARRLLLELSETASPHSPSCAERVVAYFAQAMSTRVINSCLGDVNKNLHDDYQTYQNNLLRNSFQAFNDVAPFLKLAHSTSNQAILEALHRQPFVHVIDLDFLHVGLFHWPALLHALATRPEGPPSHLRLTALTSTSSSRDLLSDAGKHLSGFAKCLGISFEFNPVVGSTTADFSELRYLICRGGDEREALAVHWLRHCLYEANGSEWKTMRLIEELRPRILTLVEQDMAWHGGSFLDRFVGSLHYYSTVFDALGACLGNEDLDMKRNMVESGVVYGEIRNVLGLGVGMMRTSGGEEERVCKIGSWRREMAARGSMAQVAMSGNAAVQAQMIVKMYDGGGGRGGGYRVVQGGDGTIRLGWKETSLYTVSAWTSCTYTSTTYINVSR